MAVRACREDSASRYWEICQIVKSTGEVYEISLKDNKEAR